MKIKTKHGVIGITDQMRAKMSGIPALSTSPLMNKGCKKNCTVKGSVCEKCYSMRALGFLKNLRDMLARNTEVLSKHIIKWDDIPVLNNAIFRFESHGDIVNQTHLKNLMRICEKNPRTNFALWTKRISLVEKYFSKNPKPKNFILVYSSLMVNKPIKAGKLADKVFTVYSKDYVKENKVDINCGAKSCLSCQKCYHKKGAKHIRELLK